MLPGETLYRIKECVDEFEYKFTESETGSLKKFRITEKGLLLSIQNLPKNRSTKLIKKLKKARLLKASQAKKSEYGDSAKYVILLLQIKRATTQMVK